MPVGDRDYIRGNHPSSCTCHDCVSKRLNKWKGSVRREPSSWKPTPPRRVNYGGKSSGLLGWVFKLAIVFILLIFGVVGWSLWGNQIITYFNNLSPGFSPVVTEPLPQSPSTDVPSSTPTAPPTEPTQVQQQPPPDSPTTDVNDGGKQETISPEIFLQNLLLDIHNLINEERVRFGLQPVTPNTFLSELAAEHCEEMVKFNYFSHERQPGYRDIDWQQQPGTKRGENIAYVPEREVIPGPLLSAQEIARITVDMWMSSPGHRENILEVDFEYTGLGVHYQDGYFYITQIFEGRMQ